MLTSIPNNCLLLYLAPVALFITYDNQTMQDGIGAQALRITGVYALARSLHIRYVHAPIIHIIEEQSHNFESELDARRLLNKVNDFFNFPNSNKAPREGHKEIYIRQPSIRDLITFKLLSLISNRDIVIKVLLPFRILDRFPSLYTSSQKILRQRNDSLLSKKQTKDVVVHLRWGYGWLYTEKKALRRRLIPLHYYKSVTEELLDFIKIEVPIEVHIHTDLVAKTFRWKPSDNKTIEQYRQVSGIDDAHEIEIPGFDLAEVFCSNSRCKFVFHYGEDFFEAFLDMCTTQHLIMSSSALSYLAGLINQNHVIWPPTHGHSKLREWSKSTEFNVCLQDKDMQVEGRL